MRQAVRKTLAPFEEDLGGWGLHEEKLAGWGREQGEWELEIVERSSSADTEGFVVLPHRWIVERTAWMADAEPPFEQRLRAAGADKRDLHRGGYDPPDIEATWEGSINLAKQILILQRHFH